jgi:hypothetical protein
LSRERCDQHCVASQPFPHLARPTKRRENGPEIRALCVFGFVSGLPARRCSGSNCRKSPATTPNIPVLQRLSAETGAIATTARPWHSFSAQSPGLDGTESGIFRADCRTTVSGVLIAPFPTMCMSQSQTGRCGDGWRSGTICVLIQMKLRLTGGSKCDLPPNIRQIGRLTPTLDLFTWKT